PEEADTYHYTELLRVAVQYHVSL
ncbi:hypothetical protein AVEN_9326-1, partial [Araneus ventricosus]